MFQLFYQVTFPVNKQGSIESPPWKQRLENDAKEREKQTIVAKKPVIRPNNTSSVHFFINRRIILDRSCNR